MDQHRHREKHRRRPRRPPVQKLGQSPDVARLRVFGLPEGQRLPQTAQVVSRGVRSGADHDQLLVGGSHLARHVLPPRLLCRRVDPCEGVARCLGGRRSCPRSRDVCLPSPCRQAIICADLRGPAVGRPHRSRPRHRRSALRRDLYDDAAQVRLVRPTPDAIDEALVALSVRAAIGRTRYEPARQTGVREPQPAPFLVAGPPDAGPAHSLWMADVGVHPAAAQGARCVTHVGLPP